MATNYVSRSALPVIPTQEIPLFSGNTQLATAYTRIVIGQRGPYMEFTSAQLIWEQFCLPFSEQWRQVSPNAYYVEWRSKLTNVKLYQQKRTVDYADYRVGYCYISPFELTFQQGDQFVPIITPLRKR